MTPVLLRSLPWLPTWASVARAPGALHRKVSWVPPLGLAGLELCTAILGLKTAPSPQGGSLRGSEGVTPRPCRKSRRARFPGGIPPGVGPP